MKGRATLADWLYPAGLIVVAALVLREAGRLAPAPFDPLGPRTFPVWIAWGLIALAAAMLARQALGYEAGRARQSMVIGLEGENAAGRRPLAAALLFLLALGYAAALSFRITSFLVATALFFFAAALLFGPRTGCHALVAAIASAAFALANDQLFRRLFALDLP